MTRYEGYTGVLMEVMRGVEATGYDGRTIALDDAITRTHAIFRRIPDSPNKVMFVGNGGSAGIASHMAIDFAKNGGVRSVAFNDASSLTCLGNDRGYDRVFSDQVDMQGLEGDVLVAVSSSGESRNVLRAARVAAAKGCEVITLSGFSPTNNLRRLGALNFHAASRVYGFVETAHQAILHAILDIGMGWTMTMADDQPTRPL